MRKLFPYVFKNIWMIIFLAILLASTLIKCAEVINGNFPFTMDQGRDMVDIRHMVVTLSPRLVGPTTSINGVLLGPFWYYFNLIPFVAGGGNPSHIVYWQILWYQISVIALWFIIKKKNISLATIISLCLLLMPTGFNTARYFWNANSMPFFTTLYFASFLYALRTNHLAPTTNNSEQSTLLLLGLVAGVAMQIEAAFGILFFPFALIYFLSIKLKLKKILAIVLGFFVTLLPQILFELKHGFIMSKLLLSEIAGRGDMLGEKITLAERFVQRWEHFRDLLFHSSHLPPNYLPYLLVASLIVFLGVFTLRKKVKSEEVEIWSLSFYFLIFAAIFYLLFPQKLKIWYTLGLSVPIVIFFGSFLNFLYESRITILKAIGIIVISLTVYYSIKSQVDYTRFVASKPSDDRSNMRNELTALDWVYQNAGGEGFRVYSYLPSVYDYPYNHLFWWYGNSKFGYQPFETAYLPNQPEYIRDVNKLWTNRREIGPRNLTFLIIEEDMDMPIRTEAWLGNFSKLCLARETTFPWHAKVEMLSPCTK